MEYKVAFLVFLIELIVGISVLIYWRRHKSELSRAREEFTQFVRRHLGEGTLRQALDDVAAGKTLVYQRRKSLMIYAWTGISAVLGVALIFIVARFTGAGLIIRTIVGILAILPFIYFTSIAIAEEFDDNSIFRFEQNTSRELLLKSQEESIDSALEEMLKRSEPHR